MKTLCLSLAAAAAFTTGTAMADHELKFERRTNARGQDFYVHVREHHHPVTTVGVYADGRGIGERHRVVERKTPVRFEQRVNAQGQTFFLYAPARD